MSNNYILVTPNKPLSGSTQLSGAKNAVLAIMASLILTKGKSRLHNVPHLSDVHQMIALLKELGAEISFDPDTQTLEADTTNISNFSVNPNIMNKMRASILVMGPLLSRFSQTHVALPGGCLIGARPIDFHLKGFTRMGVEIEHADTFLIASVNKEDLINKEYRIAFEYPSVGATENIMMFAALCKGATTTIINAALEPEVLDLVDILCKMGARITCGPSMIITIHGVESLSPVEHTIIPDRIEAGSLLLAAAITGGHIHLPDARPDHLDLFLEKLKEMGHSVCTKNGITFTATKTPQAINFKTAPYPGFPTDLQAPMMAVLCLAHGTSEVEETVYENRLIHVKELQKMGANISVQGPKATIQGVAQLNGCEIIASDIRASCALVLAGMAAIGQTSISGIQHWRRGYDKLEHKLNSLGANINIITEQTILTQNQVQL